MDEYDALIARLTATGIPFKEAAWDVAPAPPYGVYALDGGGADLWGSDRMQDTTLTGTVDLYVKGRGRDKKQLVDAALHAAGVSWYLNSIQYEKDTRLTHFEWVFEVI